jgi:hypothetical protein
MLPFEERSRGKLNLNLIDKTRSFRDNWDTVAAEVGIWIGLDTVKTSAVPSIYLLGVVSVTPVRDLGGSTMVKSLEQALRRSLLKGQLALTLGFDFPDGGSISSCFSAFCGFVS